MAPSNSGKGWSKSDLDNLRKWAKSSTLGLIAHKLGRTEESVRMKASKMRISLKLKPK